jgi:Protein of unknown function (DUF3047)
MRFTARCSALFFGLLICGVILSAELAPFSANAQTLHPAWVRFSFAKIKTETKYSIASVDDKSNVVHAIADGSASALKHPLDQALSAVPHLKWSWKIGQLPSASDAKHKESDDYAARVYITFAYDPQKASPLMRGEYALAKALYGDYPPHSALTYIVEPQLPVGTIISSPYTSRVKMIVVDSGKPLQVWRNFERNVAADYEKAFGAPPPPVSGIVIMTDADNSQSRAEAWYGPISLTRN